MTALLANLRNTVPGAAWLVGNAHCMSAAAMYPDVLGSAGTVASDFEKSNAEVKSPHMARRHGVRFVSITPKRLSMNCSTDV